MGALAIAAKAARIFAVPGMASLFVLVSFLGGIILVVLGVQGQYIARIHEEVKNRPLYLIQDLRGFERPLAAAPRTIIQLKDLTRPAGSTKRAAGGDPAARMTTN